MIKKILKGEDVSNVKCKTRLDELLKRLATGESCSDIEGCTDVEKVVKKFNEELGGGETPEEQVSILGVWRFNNTIDAAGMASHTSAVELKFTTETMDGDVYNCIKLIFMDDNSLYYTTEDGERLQAYCQGVWETEDGYYDFKKITITGGFDATHPEVIAWLQANAEKY